MITPYFLLSLVINTAEMKITKRSGDLVNFDRTKLLTSLIKSGAKESVAENVVQSIEKEIYDGIGAHQIYKMAFKMLKQESNAHAARYNLKGAMQQLGPAGFVFEKFVARLFDAEAYETRTNLILEGKCVSHEVDVIVQKDQRTEMIECKFHARSESNSDVKVPMYILSRFNDLNHKQHVLFGHNCSISGCWIVTNNRFTKDAITFGNCSGLKLLSWDYPQKNNLRTKIDSNQLYPITCLTTLTNAEKDELLTMDLILAYDLKNNLGIIEKIGLSATRVRNVVSEVSELCKF